MKIIIGSDHAGFDLKEELKKYLDTLGYDHEDLGTFSKESCDYPLIAKQLAQKVAKTKSLGILICGTGIGMSIAANKINGIRAALCCNEDSARLAKEHNDANIICMGARQISKALAKRVTKAWLETSPSKEQRHRRRVCQMNRICKC